MGVSAPAHTTHEVQDAAPADHARSTQRTLTSGFIATPDSHIPPSPLPMLLPNGTLFLAQSACKAPLQSSRSPRGLRSCRLSSEKFRSGVGGPCG